MARRRQILAAALSLPAATLAAPAFAQLAADDPRMAERAVGRADAPVTVLEFFSLTCGHCAAFHRDSWPRVRRELVETGRVRMVFRDFPLDQLALAAAGVARSLPVERYDAFVSTLFATQDRWAFARGANPAEELFRLAALAGMNRETFDAAVVDAPLQRAILEQRVQAQAQFNVNSTPTFVIGGRPVAGNIGYERFAALVAEAR